MVNNIILDYDYNNEKRTNVKIKHEPFERELDLFINDIKIGSVVILELIEMVLKKK